VTLLKSSAQKTRGVRLGAIFCRPKNQLTMIGTIKQINQTQNLLCQQRSASAVCPGNVNNYRRLLRYPGKHVLRVGENWAELVDKNCCLSRDFSVDLSA
jgi:hypothetical protein